MSVFDLFPTGAAIGGCFFRRDAGDTVGVGQIHEVRTQNVRVDFERGELARELGEFGLIAVAPGFFGARSRSGRPVAPEFIDTF